MAKLFEVGLRESSGGVKALQGTEAQLGEDGIMLTTTAGDRGYINFIPKENVAYFSSMEEKSEGESEVGDGESV